MTTQNLLTEWLEIYQKEHIKARTYSRYQGLISLHILPALGATNISELGRREIQEFLTQQKKDGNMRNGEKLSATSANMMLSVLNLAFEYACDMEYIEENPCLRVRRTKAETKKVEAFTVEEQRAIEIEIARSDDRRLHGVLLCLYTGLRIDENSFVSKSILKIFSKPIQNAEKDFPDLSAFLTNSLEHMNSLEKSNGSLTQLSNAFADMMCGAYKMLFGESNYILAIARHVSKWVYFIDAIDDLDDDIRHGHYNPIANFANSSEDLLTNHTDVLVQFISSQREELLPFYSDLQNNSVSNMIIRSIINETIPSTTKDVLLKEYGKSISAHVRYIQAKEGIIFA